MTIAFCSKKKNVIRLQDRKDRFPRLILILFASKIVQQQCQQYIVFWCVSLPSPPSITLSTASSVFSFNNYKINICMSHITKYIVFFCFMIQSYASVALAPNLGFLSRSNLLGFKGLLILLNRLEQLREVALAKPAAATPLVLLPTLVLLHAPDPLDHLQE